LIVTYSHDSCIMNEMSKNLDCCLIDRSFTIFIHVES